MISPSPDRTVAYGHPLIPPEWIAACGLRPRWIEPWRVGTAASGLRRGVCPFAAAAAEADFSADAAIVWTTSCDQMRYAAELVERQDALGSQGRLFVFNVPHTWQTPAARRLYRDELLRLAAFLKRCGGHDYTPDVLRPWMLRYQAARTGVLSRLDALSAADAAQSLVAVRGDLTGAPLLACPAVRGDAGHCLQASSGAHPSATEGKRRTVGVRLALLGGPLAPEHPLRTAIEDRGGHIVLDATEGGERTLPAAFDPATLAADPLEALVAAYFDGLADPLRRPDDAFFRWLGEAIVARRIDALILHRYLWCDTWHGLWGRLREWSPVPVLDCESVDTLGELDGRRLGRLEAFLETLA